MGWGQGWEEGARPGHAHPQQPPPVPQTSENGPDESHQRGELLGFSSGLTRGGAELLQGPPDGGAFLEASQALLLPREDPTIAQADPQTRRNRFHWHLAFLRVSQDKPPEESFYI